MTIIKTHAIAAETITQATLQFRKPSSRKEGRACNLCQAKFRPHSKFERFCTKCRSDSELYHFSEWMKS
jgi:hypothetical protein